MALYDSLSAVYDRLFPVNPATFAAVERLVPATAPRRLLDLGAATGGHLEGFMERGWEVLGIELNPAMAAHARRGVPIVEGSMLEAERLAARHFGAAARFGAILCLGNTLPHVRTDTTAAFFSAVRRLAAPGCPFMVQTLNYANPAARPGFIFPDITAGDIVFSRRYEVGADPGSLVFVTELSADGASMSDKTELYPLPPATLKKALAAAGFDRIELFADWNGAEFREDRDFYLIAAAR